MSKSETKDYTKEIEKIETKLDSLYSGIKVEEKTVDSLVLVKEYYRETREILKEQVQSLPLDSSVILLRKNLIWYEEISNDHLILDSCLVSVESRDNSN